MGGKEGIKQKQTTQDEHCIKSAVLDHSVKCSKSFNPSSQNNLQPKQELHMLADLKIHTHISICMSVYRYICVCIDTLLQRLRYL